jgi:dihydrodipicolinate synthase/N-acetylneuraminate lyase
MAVNGAYYRRADGWARDLTGVIAATCTPFEQGGALDLPRIDPYVDFLISRGVAGLMVGGTTSEFIAMTVEERSALNAAATRAAHGRVPVIAHVGHVVLRDALRLADDAARAGAPALSAIVPYYHAHTQAAIVDHLRALARAVPELPFFVYNYPAAAGNRLNVEGFADLLDEPNVAGIKLSVGSVAEMEPFLRFLPEVCVMSGNDMVWREFTAKGGRAVVSGNAAAVPEITVALLGAYMAGDAATAAQLEPLLGEVMRIGHDGAVGPLKALLRSRGFDLGTARVRSVSLRDDDQPAMPSDALRTAITWDLIAPTTA